MKIEDLDSNFKAKKLEKDLNYTKIRDTEAAIEGVCPGTWQRLPDSVLEEVGRPELTQLAHFTSGAMIRFRTDSLKVRVCLELSEPDFTMSHMPQTGISGMDIFADGKYMATFRAELGEPFVEGEFYAGKDVEVTIYLPLYNGVKEFYIDVEPGKSIFAPAPHKIDPQIVFYGSSITQGGCASRTSNHYASLVARWMDAKLHCLGFSGNAKGDLAVAEYISNMPATALIYDYDYNAPDVEFLRNTHAKFLGHILEKRPSLPVLVLSRPNPDGWEEDARKRRQIIEETVIRYQKQGYRVQFLDGRELFGNESRECCTVDGTHPNDLGFYRMAKTVKKHLSELLQLE